MPIAPILLTGFEPYGGYSRNPAFETMRALDGRVIDGVAIVGRALPVSMVRLKPALSRLLDEGEFAAIVSLGLHTGAAAIHIERSALNLADFDMTDNDGLRVRDACVSPGGPAARLATLAGAALGHEALELLLIAGGAEPFEVLGKLGLLLFEPLQRAGPVIVERGIAGAAGSADLVLNWSMVSLRS
jgi:hypothetical protein